MPRDSTESAGGSPTTSRKPPSGIPDLVASGNPLADDLQAMRMNAISPTKAQPMSVWNRIPQAAIVTGDGMPGDLVMTWLL